MNKEKLIELTKKSGTVLKNVFNVATIVVSMVIGFYASELYNKYKPTANVVEPVYTLEKTSVAINERGELMLINRESGKYTLYGNEVGRTVFELYAAKIYYQQKQAPEKK